MSDPYPTEPRRRSAVERFFGGSPAGVILRLILVSLLVGFLMSVFGVRPQDVIDGAIELFHDAVRDGFGVFRDLGAYVITGAVLVVPIWLLIRLTRRS
ncbi:DUF6460 domain-containing protein [Devosia beringensis]|uniref:DUF6460 domain-containing protein n=1 Tax=Devosia beringensis TaxID=2657486 RepID=UPI00186B61E6|nr:DUF6460 domain-containing protein [Devosia beringensis]